MGNDAKGLNFPRRDFIKVTTLAGMAATVPGTGFAGQDDLRGSFRPSPDGKKRTVLFLADSPQRYEPLMNKIRALKDFEFTVSPFQVNLQRAPETVPSAALSKSD